MSIAPPPTQTTLTDEKKMVHFQWAKWFTDLFGAVNENTENTGTGGGWTYLGSFDPTIPEEMTGIPTTATQVRVTLSSVSDNSAAPTKRFLQLGDSTSGIGNGYSISGIASVCNLDGAGNTTTDVLQDLNGKCPIIAPNYPVSANFWGDIYCSRRDDTSHVWSTSGKLVSDFIGVTIANVHVSSGTVTVPGALNKIKLSLDGGAFDAGTVYVWYQ